jgi:3-hydroxyisobutyrate dehydrogenase-like beta-hydroxyacid dehydrogenase
MGAGSVLASLTPSLLAAIVVTVTTLGFVGLGHMGGNMAARFLAAGYTVYGNSLTRRHAQHLVDDGLGWRDTPREVAESADILFTSIPDDHVLVSVAAQASTANARST